MTWEIIARATANTIEAFDDEDAARTAYAQFKTMDSRDEYTLVEFTASGMALPPRPCL